MKWTFLAIGLGLVACGSSGVPSEDAAAGAVDGPQGANDTTLPALPGRCASDAECAPERCIEVTPGGVTMCASILPESTACRRPRQPNDQCCASTDCAAGRCYEIVRREPFFCAISGGGNGRYECLTDRCASSANCPADAVCAPPGAFQDRAAAMFARLPVKGCLKASCRRDADCAQKPGGRCWLYQLGYCCGLEQLPPSLVCVYPDGCTSDDDCRGGGQAQHCGVVDGRTACVPGACARRD